MKRKSLSTIAALLCSLSIFAEETPGIIINKSDGTSITISTTSLRNIKFSDGNMVVKMKDDTQQLIDVDDITIITFADITTAIHTITDGNTETQIVITDLTGKVVYQGNAETENALSTLEGIFIVTANGKSHKVKIGK